MINYLLATAVFRGNELGDFLSSFFQVFLDTIKFSFYILFGWISLPFLGGGKVQEYFDALAATAFVSIFSIPQISVIFTYFIAGIFYVSHSINVKVAPLKGVPPASFKFLVKISRFFTYLTLPSSCLLVYSSNMHRHISSDASVPSKVFCDAVDATLANCAGSLTAKLLTYLSIIPSPKPWKVVEYIVYAVEMISGHFSR